MNLIGTSFTNLTGPTSSPALNIPPGTQPGHTLVAKIDVTGGAQVSALPAGFRLVHRDDSADGTISSLVYVKLAGASEPSTYTFTLNQSVACQASMSGWSGLDPNNPINASGGASGTGTTITAPSVTTTVANCRLVYFFSQAAGGGFANVSFSTFSLTLSVGNPLQAGPYHFAGDFKPGNPAAGASVAQTCSGGGGTWIGQTLALQPAPITTITTVPKIRAPIVSNGALLFWQDLQSYDGGTLSQPNVAARGWTISIQGSPQLTTRVVAPGLTGAWNAFCLQNAVTASDAPVTFTPT